MDKGTISLDYSSLIQSGIRGLHAENCNSIGLLGIVPEHRAEFLHAASSIGLPCAEKWIVTPDETPDWSIHENLGHRLARQLLEQCGGRDGLPDGVVITDDILALGACECLELAGVSIGRDLKVATHANRGSLVLRGFKDRLISIEFDPQEIVEAMFSSLESLMAGKPVSEGSMKIEAHIVKNGGDALTAGMIPSKPMRKAEMASPGR